MEMDLRGNGSYRGYAEGGGGGYGGGYGSSNRTYTGNWHNRRSGKLIAPPADVVLIFVCIIQSIAILTTGFRLVHRWLRHKLWWDDCCACVAIVSDGVLFIAFLLTPIQSRPSRSTNFKLVQDVAWMTLISYTIALWAARLTIAVTITRLLPLGPVKLTSKVVSCIFVVFGLALTIHKIIFCSSKTGCYNVPAYTGIIELVTDILADLWLVAAPVYMLWQMKLRPSHHRLILGIFTCGIFTTLASIAHSIFILMKWPNWIAITGHIQVMTAIVVSNLLILVTVAYRYIQRYRQRTRENHNIPNPSTSERPSTTESSGREGGRETAPDHSEFSQSRIDLTQISSPNQTYERGSVSFLSSAPFSSFSYSSGSRHGESVKSYLPEFKSEKINEEPALDIKVPPIPEHGEAESKLKPEGHATAI